MFFVDKILLLFFLCVLFLFSSFLNRNLQKRKLNDTLSGSCVIVLNYLLKLFVKYVHIFNPYPSIDVFFLRTNRFKHILICTAIFNTF